MTSEGEDTIVPALWVILVRACDGGASDDDDDDDEDEDEGEGDERRLTQTIE